MSTTADRAGAPDVVVVGGGVIGLSIAWRAADAGLAVTLLERDAELSRGTSRVAAGMLAPVSEADAGEPDVLAAGLAAARAWPAFAARLEEASGLSTGLRECGTLAVARDDDDVAWLERERALREYLGLEVARLLGGEARAIEPALAPGVRLALRVAGDHAVDARAVCAALAAACVHVGVELRRGAEVVDHDRGGATLASGERIEAGRVVLASGVWAGGDVRPVKGQILRLRDPEGPGLLERVVRFRMASAGARSSGGYVVPRGDGRYVVGATVEDRGFDDDVTAGGVRELLDQARALVPGIDELVLEEAVAGLRPTTPDNAPSIGNVDGVVHAVGHYRHGFLLAPFTADAVLALLTGAAPPADLAPFAPDRFAAAVAR